MEFLSASTSRWGAAAEVLEPTGAHGQADEEGV